LADNFLSEEIRNWSTNHSSLSLLEPILVAKFETAGRCGPCLNFALRQLTSNCWCLTESTPRRGLVKSIKGILFPPMFLFSTQQATTTSSLLLHPANPTKNPTSPPPTTKQQPKPCLSSSPPRTRPRPLPRPQLRLLALPCRVPAQVTPRPSRP